MKYTVVSRPELEDFIRGVNILLSEGFVLLGDIKVTSHKPATTERARVLYTQALVFMEKNEE